MATTSTVAIPNRAEQTAVPSDAVPGETLGQKVARYSSPEFKAALIRHFHVAKQGALQDSPRSAQEAAVSPTKARR